MIPRLYSLINKLNNWHSDGIFILIWSICVLSQLLPDQQMHVSVRSTALRCLREGELRNIPQSWVKWERERQLSDLRLNKHDFSTIIFLSPLVTSHTKNMMIIDENLGFLYLTKNVCQLPLCYNFTHTNLLVVQWRDVKFSTWSHRKTSLLLWDGDFIWTRMTSIIQKLTIIRKKLSMKGHP